MDPWPGSEIFKVRISGGLQDPVNKSNSLCVIVRPDFLRVINDKRLNTDASTRVQLPSIKAEIEEICQNVKQRLSSH